MKPRTAVTIVGSIGVLTVGGVIYAYVSQLGALAFTRTDPGSWGQFGDYIGGLLNPLFAFLNVIVVVYIALSVQQLGEIQRKNEQESERRIQTVIDLHREWNSSEVYGSRTRASAVVRRYPSHIIFEMEKHVAYEEMSHVWILIGFFQRLAFLVEHDKVHREMTMGLFGELFVWWWVAFFEKQLLPCECDARNQIVELKNWVYSNTSEIQRAPWVGRASKEMRAAIESANAAAFLASKSPATRPPVPESPSTNQ